MKKPITLSIGEILWDILPSGKVLGGAPSNVAWHAKQLGADAHIISAVGNDVLGDEIIATLEAMSLPVDGIARLDNVPTSTVTASIAKDGNASYVIHENVAWDHLIVDDTVLSLARKAIAVNFGSLGQRGFVGNRATQAILDNLSQEAIVAFDVNLRPPHYSSEVLVQSLKRANVVKMNHEELSLLAGMHGWGASPHESLTACIEQYSHLNHIIVTRGAEGCWWRTRTGLHEFPSPRGGVICDTIGAGDSVTATAMMGILKGWAIDVMVTRAMDIAAFICSCQGGTPELPEYLLEPFRT